MITPLEIENKKFKKELIGYSVVEVEEFMQTLGDSYEGVYRENLAYKDKVNVLTNAIAQYKSMEETLQNAILVAQSAGEEVTRNAKKKAENIIAEAENKAAQILADASNEVTKVSYEYEQMKRNVEVFRTKIISLLTSQLDIVKEFSTPGIKDGAEKSGKAENAVPEKLADESTDSSNVMETLKKLERVTMELPKIVMNEKGEYVAAEDAKQDAKPSAGVAADDGIDEDLGF